MTISNITSIVIHNTHDSEIPVVTGCPFSAEVLSDYNCATEIIFPDGNFVEA